MAGPSQQSRRSWSPDEPFDLAIHPKSDSSLSPRVRHGAATLGDEPDLPDLEAFIGSNDAEDSPWNQPLARLPPQLRDSSAIDALVRLSGKSLNDESLRDVALSPALQDLIGASAAFPRELFELLFVWLYNYGPAAQRLLALCQKADDGRITIALLVQARSSLLSPPSWLASSCNMAPAAPPAAGSTSVLHVGSVSPLAMMPRIEPFRMKSLWAMHLLQTRANATVTGPKELPFACHFYKRFPPKHLRCLFHHQKAPRYVKTHLDRCHRLPIHCPACWETFDTQDECDDHDPDHCASTGHCPFTDADGMTNEQVEQLETLSPGDGATKWYEMWNVLFPDDPEPDSPYIDPEDTGTMAAASVHNDGESTYRQSLEELQRRGGLTAMQVQEVMRFFTQTPTSRRDASTASSSFYEPLDPRFQLAGQAGQPPMQETDFIFTPFNDSQDAQSHSPIPQHLRHRHYHRAEAHASRDVFPFQSSQQPLAPTTTYHDHAQHQPHRQQQFRFGHNGFFYQQAGSYVQGDPAVVVPQLHQHDVSWPGEPMQSTQHRRLMLVPGTPTASQAANSTSRRSKPPPAQGEGSSSSSMSHEASYHHQRGGVYEWAAPPGDVFYHADSGLPYDPSTYPTAQKASWTCPG